jgi:hypothetical protein
MEVDDIISYYELVTEKSGSAEGNELWRWEKVFGIPDVPT